jgi:hypothetical protein
MILALLEILAHALFESTSGEFAVIVVSAPEEVKALLEVGSARLNENGKARSHQLEPVTIIVKERGINGWIKEET